MRMIDTAALIDGFEKLRDVELEALPQIDRDETRAELDEAAAQVAKIDGRDMARWREAIAREPSVCASMQSALTRTRAPRRQQRRGDLGGDHKDEIGAHDRRASKAHHAPERRRRPV